MRRFVTFALSILLPALLQGGLARPAAAAHHEAPTAQSDCTPGWNALPPLADVPGSRVSINGLDALAPDDIWVVGNRFDPDSSSHTVTEHWDGSAWTVVPSPDGAGSGGLLESVAVLDSGDAWAVGSTFGGSLQTTDPLVLHWNGTAWTAVAVPKPSGSVHAALEAVDADAPDDVWAVGLDVESGNQGGFALHFDGTSWHLVPVNTGDSNGFDAVSVDGANDVWAAGSTGGPGQAPLVEHWNGSSWSIQNTPNPGLFGDHTVEGIAVAQPDEMWAVGGIESFGPQGSSLHGSFVMMTRGGAAWTAVDTPHPPGLPFPDEDLSDVMAFDANDVWAVGRIDGRGVGMNWDGAEWHVIPSATDDLSRVDDARDGSLWSLADAGGVPVVASLCEASEGSDLWALAPRDNPYPVGMAVQVGSRLRDSAFVWNAGGQPATNVSTRIRVSRSLRVAAAHAGQGSCSVNRRHRLVRCHLGTVAAGDSVEIRLLQDVTGLRAGGAVSISSPDDPYAADDRDAYSIPTYGKACTKVGTEGHDVLRGTKHGDVFCGLGGNDVIIPRAGRDIVYAGPGNDRVLAGTGLDEIDGGPGRDVIGFRTSRYRVRADLAVSGGAQGPAGFTADGFAYSGRSHSYLIRVEGVGGSRFNDVLRGGTYDYGQDLDNWLWGRAGNDRVVGGPGNDHLFGGPGRDLVSGGEGRDHCAQGPGRGRVIRCER